MYTAHVLKDKQRTEDILADVATDFESLLLSPNVIQGLRYAGFVTPSPIQLQAIPYAKCGVDLICQAKSGTGKTCVFTVCALEVVDVKLSTTQVLVLAPTREIAHQIHGVISSIGSRIDGLCCGLFIGGTPTEQDIKTLKSCHIATGTPGRVKYLIEQGNLSTEFIRLFVLDEADKLLEEGKGSFQEQINWIYSTLQKDKQVLALSATYPESLAKHLTDYMQDPVHVRINVGDLTLKGVKQYMSKTIFHPFPVKSFEEKCERLLMIIREIPFQQCMVFSNFQSRAENLSKKLCKEGWPCTFIAGSQIQAARVRAMDQLKNYNCRVLITTDLTARGIDCDKVDLVINLDLPWETETYLHRVGRAGRYGSFGIAISIVSEGDEVKHIQNISTEVGKKIAVLPSVMKDVWLQDDSCDIGKCNGDNAINDNSSVVLEGLDNPASIPAELASTVPVGIDSSVLINEDVIKSVNSIDASITYDPISKTDNAGQDENDVLSEDHGFLMLALDMNETLQKSNNTVLPTKSRNSPQLCGELDLVDSINRTVVCDEVSQHNNDSYTENKLPKYLALSRKLKNKRAGIKEKKVIPLKYERAQDVAGILVGETQENVKSEGLNSICQELYENNDFAGVQKSGLVNDTDSCSEERLLKKFDGTMLKDSSSKVTDNLKRNLFHSETKMKPARFDPMSLNLNLMNLSTSFNSYDSSIPLGDDTEGRKVIFSRGHSDREEEDCNFDSLRGSPIDKSHTSTEYEPDQNTLLENCDKNMHNDDHSGTGSCLSRVSCENDGLDNEHQYNSDSEYSSYSETSSNLENSTDLEILSDSENSSCTENSWEFDDSKYTLKSSEDSGWKSCEMDYNNCPGRRWNNELFNAYFYKAYNDHVALIRNFWYSCKQNNNR